LDLLDDEESESRQIPDEFRDCLHRIFRLYASSDDGTMYDADFTRYSIVCGSRNSAASEMYMDEGELSFEEFCSFYEDALCEGQYAVWNDLFVHQFRPNLKSNGDPYDAGSVRDIIAKDERYEEVVRNLLRIIHDDEAQFSFDDFIRFPQPYSLRQRMVDLDEPLFDIINTWNNSVHLRVVYQAMMLHSLCRDEEWKGRFVRKGGMDHLLQMLLYAALCMTSYEQGYTLLIVYVTDILYEICYGHCSTLSPRHILIGEVSNVISMLIEYEDYGAPEVEIFGEVCESMAVAPTNLLIHAIRVKTTSDRSLIADLVDELPRRNISVCSLPLICGYIRSERISLPEDITRLIAFYF